MVELALDGRGSIHDATTKKAESIEDHVSKPSHHAPPTSAHTCHFSFSGESKLGPEIREIGQAQ